MQRKSFDFFVYPPNLHVLDLASIVAMYRDRGEPRRAKTGEYFACAQSKKLVKEAKYWFGLYYSQVSWNQLLTKNSSGYPLTEIEFHIMGMAVCPPNDSNHRSHIEANSGIMTQLSFLIVNDLRQFGFIQEYDNGFLAITNNGLKALEGFAQRAYGKKFVAEMLPVYQSEEEKLKIREAEKREAAQTRLF